ncbi:MAG: sigma-70 family RNA polymerase sigma factor [bacterium]|nr:sigma-70 family RNA polymerase sigma factor [bacterium]
MSGASELSDEILLTRLLAGCEESFTTLYRRRQGRVFRFAFEMSGSEAIAEEATQEVFLGMLNGSCSYDPAKGKLSSFLMGVARNQVLRLLKRDSRYSPIPEGAEDSAGRTAPADLVHQETVEAVRRAVLSLPESYREVVVMCDLEEMDYAEAAAALDCPMGTVRSRLHRGRALLAEKLSGATRSLT